MISPQKGADETQIGASGVGNRMASPALGNDILLTR